MAIARINLTTFVQNSNYRDRYVAAVKKIKQDGIYQIFVDWHADPDVGNIAHINLSFLGWHRIFIRLFEIELQKADLALQTAINSGFDPNQVISLPWWDYPNMNSGNLNHARGRIWRDDFLGGNGTGSNITVSDGPFRENHEWPIQRRTNPRLSISPFTYESQPPGHLTRNLARAGLRLPSNDEINHCINRINLFDDNNFTTQGSAADSSSNSFRAVLEGFAITNAVKRKNESQMHNGIHVWVGGMMGSVPPAPNDPVFWLHHANVDRIWALWQIRHPNLSDQYPTDSQIDAVRVAPSGNPFARELDDPQVPWDSSAKAWTKPDGSVLFTTEIYRIRDVLNWSSMGAGLGDYEIAGANARAITF